MVNNLKYKVVLAIEAILLIQLFILIFIKLNIYTYEKLDLTGMNKNILYSLVIVLLILFFFSIFHYINIQNNGNNNVLDICLASLFILYSIIVIISFIYLRHSEEKISLQMKYEIENSQKVKSNQKNTLNSLLKRATIELEYEENDEYYNRKKAIIKQVENSSSIQRYLSLLIINPAYEYYDDSTTVYNEVEYYVGYLELFIIGIALAIFYFKETFYNGKSIRRSEIY